MIREPQVRLASKEAQTSLISPHPFANPTLSSWPPRLLIFHPLFTHTHTHLYFARRLVIYPIIEGDAASPIPNSTSRIEQHLAPTLLARHRSVEQQWSQSTSPSRGLPSLAPVEAAPVRLILGDR
ncbi:hypothetical protein RRG08_054371 [Elysia crispata]|uniref:Uncharacterized protein n=1 Tax=Elysia crispata TaxID=231223 RepID=A0AAE1EA91_9GAST|nr:hypothetical protein RRG08_054371 [Elysia crispata]